jgi:hypothetical protein
MENSPTMTKAEVIEHLGKSTRSVETYVKSGKLPAKYVNGPNGKTLVFERVDVEQFKQSSEESWTPNVTALANTPGAAPARTSEAEGVIRLLTAMLQNRPASAPEPFEGRVWLTLDEAAKLSGLPRPWLVAQARLNGSGYYECVKAMNVGTERKASWRFHRGALTR